VLEAYTTLARVTPEPRVAERLRVVLELMLTRVVSPHYPRLQLFFDETWAPQGETISYGHDVEASWLLCEAAEALGDEETTSRVKALAGRMAQMVYEGGIDADGGLCNEALRGAVDGDKDWWVQAEAIVGFVNAYELTGATHFFEAAARVWDFVERRVLDREHGEWYWRVHRDQRPALDLPKVSEWKCPYHNGRMCFEVGRRLAGG
jgi:mannobiose 2-epimerase